MPNKHLEHPEDNVLTGDLSSIDTMASMGQISVKVDGAPAVVWGTLNGRFFVGNKSVFNKRLIKTCFTHEDIDGFYAKQPGLANILHACLDYLPRTEGIYQGDFVGFGGAQVYTPNTLTYIFPEIVEEVIIVAPHTQYTLTDKLCNASASPLDHSLPQSKAVRWFIPQAQCNNAAVVRPSVYAGTQFLDAKSAAAAKVSINALIRTGQELTINNVVSIVGNFLLAKLYIDVINYKHQLMSTITTTDCVGVQLNGDDCAHEGYVVTDANGSVKLVNRAEFSRANFLSGAPVN